ncbi:MAG TPA: FUSC family membrane protein, partial [Ferruginibacter sp.]|nr:FUSC family membrane protein [Ferruginibacter sp.]
MTFDFLMDLLKEYRIFINSNSLGDGVRMTAGIILPAVICYYFNLLPIGIVVAVGAMCVSLADTPGPIPHRINSMVACCTIGFLVALITGFAVPHPIVLGVVIPCICFAFSMIGVYGSRANAIGVAVLMVMVLTIERKNTGWLVVYNALYIFAGGLWYMLMSLLLYYIRPYKIAQQVLGNSILATSDYLRIRASFYDKNVDYEKSYQQMLEQQIAVQEKQNLVREILFKTGHIVKDTTDKGVILRLIFRDSIDLFERVMTSYQDYEALQKTFENSDILLRFENFILEVATELDEIGLAVKRGKASIETGLLLKHFQELHGYFEEFRDANRTPENVESFINLRHILTGIEDIVTRIHELHLYTTYDQALVKDLPAASEYQKFVSQTVIDT